MNHDYVIQILNEHRFGVSLQVKHPEQERLALKKMAKIDYAVTALQSRAVLDSTAKVAVDKFYHWQPMSTCPRGTKVQLLGQGGVAVYSIFNGKDSFWEGWAPLPTKKKD